MIQIRYQVREKSWKLSLDGHAGFDEPGRDIVCAGVSAIVYALLGWIENEDLAVRQTRVEKGRTRICCAGSEKADTAFTLAVIGLEQIARKYPDHVAIEITGLAG